ncbi:PIN domain-like protein [Lentinula raphanica]|nr:PIN domain-like protein [Lentinula raphanica]
MGVLGLTPFIQKTCPEVIKRLPDRLQGFSGKRIALDGTLLTQRFHFAQIPHPYRHVLGWYRLIKELEQFGVEAICVFDGKGRNAAKAQEASRRRNAQRLVAARAVIETERLARLRKISYATRDIAKLSTTEKGRLSGILAQSSTVADLSSPSTEQFAELEANSPLSRDDVPYYAPSRWVTKTPDTPSQSTESVGGTTDEAISKETGVDKIMTTLTPLFLDYQNSISKVASTSMRVAQKQEHPDAGANQDGVQEVYEMSKRQCELTLQEGQFWDSLTSTLADLKDPSTDSPSGIEDDGHHRILQELTSKSNIISESYRNSTNPPTSQTYMQSKEILQAMGVPCIDCDGPFEAEALASSLVLNGYADYVASEDTDVIIYEVPLIRNITSRQQPLLVISGTELRSMLKLTRAMFVDFALLMGTDFSQRIRQVGPRRALDFIRAHESIENVIEAETRFQPRGTKEEYLRQVNMARKVFQTLPPVPEDALESLRNEEGHSSKYNLSRVLFIMGKYGLSREVDWDSEDALKGNFFDDNPSQ